MARRLVTRDPTNMSSLLASPDVLRRSAALYQGYPYGLGDAALPRVIPHDPDGSQPRQLLGRTRYDRPTTSAPHGAVVLGGRPLAIVHRGVEAATTYSRMERLRHGESKLTQLSETCKRASTRPTSVLALRPGLVSGHDGCAAQTPDAGRSFLSSIAKGDR